MTRSMLLAAVVLPLAALPALGQGIRDTTPPALVRPINPYLPAISQIGPAAGRPGAILPAYTWGRPWAPAWTPYWSGGYYPYPNYPYATGIYYGSPYYGGWGMSGPTMDYGRPLQAPPLQGAGVSSQDAALVVNPELPAELTVQFPASAEVTLNGAAAKGEGATRTLTSPPLKAGESHTFDVKAKWTADGKRYEWERTVTLGSGERSKVTVARGFPVKD